MDEDKENRDPEPIEDVDIEFEPMDDIPIVPQVVLEEMSDEEMDGEDGDEEVSQEAVAVNLHERSSPLVLLCRLRVLRAHDSEETRNSCRHSANHMLAPIHRVSESHACLTEYIAHLYTARDPEHQAPNMAISIGTDPEIQLNPVIESSERYDYTELRPNGVIVRRNDCRIAMSRRRPFTLDCRPGGYIVIVGQNGSYVCDIAFTALICYAPLVVFNARDNYRMVRDTHHKITLGLSGHVVLSAFGVTVVLVGEGGVADELVTYCDQNMYNPYSRIEALEPLVLRACSGRHGGDGGRDVYVVQVRQRIDVRDYNEFHFALECPHLFWWPILMFYTLAYFYEGVVRVGDRLLSGDGDQNTIPFDVSEELNAMAVHLNGYMYAPILTAAESTRIRPEVGDMIVLTSNGSVGLIRTDPLSVLLVFGPVVVFRSEAFNTDDTSDHMVNVEPDSDVYLRYGRAHLCFVGDSGAVLLAGGSNGWITDWIELE